MAVYDMNTVQDPIETFEDPTPQAKEENRISKFLHLISVEPFAMFSLFSHGVLYVSFDNLLLEKSCLADLGYPSQICSRMHHNDTMIDYRSRLKQDTVDWRLILLATALLPALLFKLVAGNWSDVNGRKSIFALAIFANIVRVLIFMITVYLRHGRALWVLVANVVFQTLGGAFLAPLCFAYVSDITSTQNRTARFMYLSACIVVGFASGILAGAAIVRFYGYYAVAIFSLSFSLVALSYERLVIRETKLRSTKKKTYQVIINLFSPSNVQKTAKVIWLKRADNSRVHLNLLLLSYFFVRFLGNCHWVLQETYTTSVYNWGLQDSIQALSIISSTQLVVLVVSSVFVITIAQLSDVRILIIGMTSSVLSCIIVGSSSWAIMYYTGSICGALSSFLLVVILSWMSRQVEDHEYGKLMAWVSIIEILGGHESSSAFLFLFQETKSNLPGSVFLVAALLHIIPVTCLCIVRKQSSDEIINSSHVTSSTDKSDDDKTSGRTTDDVAADTS